MSRIVNWPDGVFRMTDSKGVAYIKEAATVTVDNDVYDDFISAGFTDVDEIISAEVVANAITPIKMGTRTVVALTDAAATPTIAQLMTSSIFTITPTAARTFTTPTAAVMVAGISGATVGTWFDFTIVNTAAFAVTVTAASGVTLSGNAVVNKGSGTFRAVLTNVTGSSEAVTIYRMASGSTVADMALADGKLLIGASTGLAAEQTMTGDVTITAGGVTTIGAGRVTAAMLANNAAGLNSVGMGASASYTKATDGVQTLATGTAGAKTCLFVVVVTEAFANGDGAQPTFAFGEVGTATKFAATSLLTDATLGQIKVFPGSLTASTNVIVTATAGTGTTETGAIAVSVIILPTAS